MVAPVSIVIDLQRMGMLSSLRVFSKHQLFLVEVGSVADGHFKIIG